MNTGNYEIGDEMVEIETLDTFIIVAISKHFYLLERNGYTHTFTEDYLYRNFEVINSTNTLLKTKK
tara:strand:- start:335 stop:532 length:198 start_codon:yes stop_codon:yes gene_type:complete